MAERTLSARILEYVRANPSCTTHAIGAKFGLPLCRVGGSLGRMQKAGLVTRAEQQGTRAGLYTAVDEDIACGLPTRQIITQSWTDNHVGHWIDFALAGRTMEVA